MAKCNHLVFVYNETIGKQFKAEYADGKVVDTFAYANKFCPKCGKLIERPTPAEKKRKK
jgi:hypothetical protein